MSTCIAPDLAVMSSLAAAVAAGNAGRLVRSEGRVVVLSPLGREVGDATDVVRLNPRAFYEHQLFIIPTIATVALTCENEVQS